MNRRLILAGLSAIGGLMTAAFLQVAVATADVSATGADAFTIGTYTFDPFTVGPTGADVEGFAPVDPLSGAPPLLELGEFTPQSFEVFDPTTGADLGSIDTSETVTDLLSLVNSAFTVEDVAAADGGSASDLPTLGSVYDAFTFGGGFDNVYTAIPSATGGADTVTDTLVTPLGNVNLDSLFGSIDAAAPLNPGAAFTGLCSQTTAASAPTPSPSVAPPSTPPLRPEARALTLSPRWSVLRRCWNSAAARPILVVARCFRLRRRTSTSTTSPEPRSEASTPPRL
jgi:hypothetical protein